MRAKIAPSILSADFGRLHDEVQAAEAAGADWIHVDVMDGHFVPNITIGPAITAAVRRATTLPVDVHLMIEHPERYLDDFVDSGADLVTVHQEACLHLHRAIQQVRELGAKVGVTINPSTPVATLTEVVGSVDLILIMSVNPGFGGQVFIPGSVGKVREARALIDCVGGSDTELEVDGGVTAGNAAELVEAGATVLVAGSAVFGHPEGPGGGVRAIAAALETQD